MAPSPESAGTHNSEYNPDVSVTEQLFRMALIGSSIPTPEDRAIAQIAESEILLHEAEEYRR